MTSNRKTRVYVCPQGTKGKHDKLHDWWETQFDLANREPFKAMGCAIKIALGSPDFPPQREQFETVNHVRATASVRLVFKHEEDETTLYLRADCCPAPKPSWPGSVPEPGPLRDLMLRLDGGTPLTFGQGDPTPVRIRAGRPARGRAMSGAAS